MHLKKKITFAGSTIDIIGKFTISCEYLIYIKNILGGFFPKIKKFKIPTKIVIPLSHLFEKFTSIIQTLGCSC